MPLSTFSIVAVDRDRGEIGIAVQSKFLSVGAVVPWVRAGVGAVATQSFANTTFGPRGLALLERGVPPNAVLDELLAADGGRETRQVGIVAAGGRARSFTGAECIPWAGGRTGDGFAAQGNCLAGPAVVDALAEAFVAARGTLSHRLVAALAAAEEAGGDKRGQQSAALIVEKPGGGYGAFNDRYVDLRVDDHPRPIDELARILELHALYFFPAEPGDVIPIDADLGVEIARLLVRAGAHDDATRFDERTQAALVAYMHVENLENRVRDDGAIDRQTLGYLRAHAGARDVSL
ncbi:MAG TPA: DUF1028 domain-containing protein [Candidatus Baltobacteraceae bacterium]|nr:DUF1028 domain-containing protein [Candidatus Baltobacteraceae bacterium]